MASTLGDTTSRQRVFLSLLAALAGAAMQFGFWLFAFAFCKESEFGRLNIAWAAGFGLGQFLMLNEHRRLIDHPEKLGHHLTTLGHRFGLACAVILMTGVFFLNASDWPYVLLIIVLAAQYLLQLPSQSMAVGMGQVRFELLFRLLGPLVLLLLGLPVVAIFGLSFLPVVVSVVALTVVLMLGWMFNLYREFLPSTSKKKATKVGLVEGIYFIHVALDACLYPAVFFLITKLPAVNEIGLGLRLLVTISGVVVSAMTMYVYKYRTSPWMQMFSKRSAWLGLVLWLGWAFFAFLVGEQLVANSVVALWVAILVWQFVLSLVGILSLWIVDTRGQIWFSVRAMVHHALVISAALWVYFANFEFSQGDTGILLWVMSGVLLTTAWASFKKRNNTC